MPSGSSLPPRGPAPPFERADGAAESPSAKALRVWLEFGAEPRPEASHPGQEDADEEVDAALAEFGGDFRATIRALLHDIAVLAGDLKATVSRGYVRGRASAGARRRAGLNHKME